MPDDRQYPTVSKERVARILEFATIEGYRQDYQKKRLRLSTEEPHFHAYMSARINYAAKQVERLIFEGATFALIREEVKQQLEFVAAEALWLGRQDDDFGMQDDRDETLKFLERLWKTQADEKGEGA